MPCCTNFVKPVFSTVTSYVPTGKAVNVKAPLSPDVETLSRPVSRLRTVILAFATAAPDGSMTVTPRVDVVYWASRQPVVPSARKQMRNRTINWQRKNGTRHPFLGFQALAGGAIEKYFSTTDGTVDAPAQLFKRTYQAVDEVYGKFRWTVKSNSYEQFVHKHRPSRKSLLLVGKRFRCLSSS